MVIPTYSATPPEAAVDTRPVAWRYRYSANGEWCFATESVGGIGLKCWSGFEEQPLYAADYVRHLLDRLEAAERGVNRR